MAARLSETMRAAGGELSAALDRLGLQAQAVGWIKFDEDSDWRFYVVTRLFDVEGPRWLYSRLLRAINKLGLADGFDTFAITVASPRDPLFQSLSRVFVVRNGAEISGDSIIVNDINLQEMHLYFIDRQVAGSAASEALKFEKRVKDLIAA
jgi:hypothetical protein